jgi:hypothetical protein
MVDFATLPIPVVPYTSARKPRIGMSMTLLSEMRTKPCLTMATAPHRLAFHQVMLIGEGTGDCTIDSTRYRCRAGSLLWIRPNQVIQFAPAPDMEARIVTFTETFPLRLRTHMGLLDDVLRPSHWQLRDDALATFGGVLDMLQEEFDRPDQWLGEDILKHLLTVTLLHIIQICRTHDRDPALSDSSSPENGELFLRFRRELENRRRGLHQGSDRRARRSGGQAPAGPHGSTRGHYRPPARVHRSHELRQVLRTTGEYDTGRVQARRRYVELASTRTQTKLPFHPPEERLSSFQRGDKTVT